MRWHGTLHPCYGVFNIKVHNELHTPFFGGLAFRDKALHTKCGASRNAVAWDIAPMLWCFNIKGHNELHTPFLEVSPFVTMSCIHKAEPPEMRWHGTLHPCYGVLILKVTMRCIRLFGGLAFCDNELHTQVSFIFSMSGKKLQGGVTKRCMLWCF